MPNDIPDYSNLKMNLNGLNTFLKDSDITLSQKDKEKIITIFNKCDTANEKNQKKADGLLTGEERTTFLNEVKKSLPNMYDKLVDFSVTVEVIEDMNQQKEIMKLIQKQKKE